ncbi:hypothetical protein BDV12DRAFT_194532 [Aspergillus spectabilis]
MTTYNLRIVIMVDGESRTPSESRPRWAASIGRGGASKRTWYSSRRLSDGRYQRQVQKNQRDSLEQMAFHIGAEFPRFKVTEEERSTVDVLFEEVEAGPAAHFVLRFLWKFVEIGWLEPTDVEKFWPLAHYTLTEWLDHNQRLLYVDGEFLERRFKCGWDLSDEEDDEEVDEEFDDPPPPYSSS